MTPLAFPGRRLRLLAGPLLALLLLTAFPAASPAAPARGQHVRTLARLGFSPSQRGFSFPNYGPLKGGVNLTAVEMQRLFGAAVCVSGEGPTCVLAPAAHRWMATQNSYMAAGHCEGFSVGSLLLFRGLVAPDGLGGPAVPALKLGDNAALQSFIAYGYAFQSLPRVANKVIWNIDPRGVVRYLMRHLGDRKAGWTLHIFKPDGSGGHAITPTAILQLGRRAHTYYAVRVYDNNWPDSNRWVYVNFKRDTWRYKAAINPKEHEDVYKGTRSSDTLQIENMAPGVGIQACPFCHKAKSKARTIDGRPRAAGATDYVQIALTGDQGRGRHAHLLIRDDAGHTVGTTRAGRVVRDFPGATAAQMTAGVRPWTGDPEPIYTVPQRAPLSVALQPGRNGANAAPQGVSLLGPGTVAAVDGIDGSSGGTVAVSGSLSAVAFHNSRQGQQSPSLTLGAQTDHGAVEFTVTAHDLPGQQQIGMSLDDATGTLVVQPPAGGQTTVDLTATSTDASGTQKTFTSQDVTVTSGQPATVDYGAWAAGDAPVTVSGTSDDTPPPAPAVSTPAIASVSPGAADAGATDARVVIGGSGFADGAAVTFANSGVSVLSTQVMSAAQIEVHVAIAAGSSTGATNVTVKNPDSGTTTAAGAFRVDAAPSLGLAALRSAYQGAVTQTTGLAAFFPLDPLLGDNVAAGPSLTSPSGVGSPAQGGAWDDGYAALDSSSGQYLALSDNPWKAASAFTWEGWVRWNGAAAGPWQCIFDFGNDTDNYVFLAADPYGGNIPRFEITAGSFGNRQNLDWSVALPVGSWHLVTVTEDAVGTVDSYLDGVPVAHGTGFGYSPASIGATADTWLGRSLFVGQPGHSDVTYDGGEQNVTLATTALPASDVAAHFAAASPASPASAAPGTTGLAVTITGSGFEDGATVAFDAPGVTVTGTHLDDSQHLVATISVDAGATTGPSGLTVHNPDGTSVRAPVAFSVVG